MYYKFDVVIVGAGGAGLMAAMQLPNASVAVLSKVYPTRSHTGAAQGGVAAALGNQEEDHWKWHMYDTVKGGDYMVDQPAAEILAREAIDAVYELEHRGLPFNRTPDGRIDQRRFGGHTRNFGEAAVRRACYAADRTGHMPLQTIHQSALKTQEPCLTAKASTLWNATCPHSRTSLRAISFRAVSSRRSKRGAA